jgi:hypothetical protein
MATKLAPGIYQVTPTEGISITVDCVGTGFVVIANIDTSALTFAAAVPTRITPAMMGGVGSVHTINIRCFFTQGATTAAAYTINTTDDQGGPLDGFNVPIVSGQALPYQTLVQILLVVS